MKKMLMILGILMSTNVFADVTSCPAATAQQVQAMKERLVAMGRASMRAGARDVTFDDLSATVYFDVNVVAYYFNREDDCSFTMMENGKFTGKKRLRYMMKANTDQFIVSSY